MDMQNGVMCAEKAKKLNCQSSFSFIEKLKRKFHPVFVVFVAVYALACAIIGVILGFLSLSAMIKGNF